MASDAQSGWLTDEVAEFLASLPTREELLAYRPSVRLRKRLNELLTKSRNGLLGTDEEWELQQFEHLELLLQAIKARLRSPRSVPS